MSRLQRWILSGSLLLLTACGGSLPPVGVVRDGAPSRQVRVDHVPDAVPRVEPRSRGGNAASYVVWGKRYYTLPTSKGYRARGIASWYGTKFHGRQTANGERYNMYTMSAAHRSLPLPTFVEVTNLQNGRRVIVRVNDRGPFHPNRIIDLSYAAAARLDILRRGTGLVELRAIDPATYRAGRSMPSEHANPADTPTATDSSGPAVEPVLAGSPGRVNLYLQLGAFSVRSNAERLIRRLAPLPVPGVRIQTVRRQGKDLYRVRVGPLLSVELADNVVKTLETFGFSHHRVVIE